MTVDELIRRLQELSNRGHGSLPVTRREPEDDIFELVSVELVSDAVVRGGFWNREGLKSVGLE